MFGESNEFTKWSQHHIDVKVAEHVMGWERTNEEIYPGGAISSNYRSRAWRIPGRGLVAEEFLPRFSGGIAVAWEVVEHLRKKGFLITPIAFPDTFHDFKLDVNERGKPVYKNAPMEPGDRYQCLVSSSENPESGDWIVRSACSAKTAPLAICLSALKVVGVEL